MENFIIEETQNRPSINFNLQNGELTISGSSIPENPISFFAPLVNALDVYSKSPNATTTVTFKMEYINTSSAKHILDVLKKLETINANGSAVTVTWIYEHDDQDMQEAGNDYQLVVNLPFNIVPIKE